MPEPTTTEATDATGAVTDTTTVPTTATATAREPEAPNREAAKYRRQLRESETKATALTERLDGMQRREVERLVANELSEPGDVWLAGVELADVLDDDGEVDATKVSTALAAVLETRPGWRRTEPPAYDGGARQSIPRPVSMQEVLQGRGRQA